ncbi:MAG: hypothetical protein ACUVYA_01460 [Planctomycetota bacterium]
MGDASVDFAVATGYALVGAALSLAYRASPRLREEPVFHGITVFLALACLAIAVATEAEAVRENLTRAATRFVVFFAASLFYVPALVFLALRYSELALERMMSAGSRKPPPRRAATQREEWQKIQKCLRALACDPTDARAREDLGDLYARLGFFDSAAYEYQKAARWVPRGYAHGLLLYKAAWILVERKRRVDSAVSVLRKIVSLYPKSFFAAYSRRVLNGYESRSGTPLDTTSV